MLFLLVLAVSLVVSTFFGHLIHWAIHQRWTGPAHKGHMEHHLELYPPGDLVSRSYRSSKWYHSGVFLFTPGFIALMAVFGFPAYLLGLPLWTVGVFGVVMLSFGLLNDYVHDNMHVWNHWLNRFAWFRRARVTHFVHHRNMKVNYGIFFFAWDKVFGSYREK